MRHPIKIAKAIAAVGLAAGLLVGCVAASASGEDVRKDLLTGAWDGRTGAAVNDVDLKAQLKNARFVLLGEKHDNPFHHSKQAELLRLVASEGRKPALVWEMVTLSQRAVLDAYLNSGRANADGLGRILGWDKSGWPEWGIYLPIAAVALEKGLAQHPGNVDRADVRRLAREGFDGLSDETARQLALGARWDDEDAAALKTDLVASHCGFMPDGMIAPMGYVQRGRDAVMAGALLVADVGDGAVLIAGNGHVRADRGVPRYLGPGNSVLSIGILEVVDGVTEPLDYLDQPGHFDLILFTDRVETPDRCEELKKRFGKKPPSE